MFARSILRASKIASECESHSENNKSSAGCDSAKTPHTKDEINVPIALGAFRDKLHTQNGPVPLHSLQSSLQSGKERYTTWIIKIVSFDDRQSNFILQMYCWQSFSYNIQ